MTMSITDMVGKMTAFETILQVNYPNLLGDPPNEVPVKFSFSCKSEVGVTAHLIGYDVPARAFWDEVRGDWYGYVNDVEYNGATPLETLQLTFAAAKAALDAKIVEAEAKNDDLVDQG